jgi:hypothetical protein
VESTPGSRPETRSNTEATSAFPGDDHIASVIALPVLPGIAARDVALKAAGGQPMDDLTNALNLQDCDLAVPAALLVLAPRQPRAPVSANSIHARTNALCILATTIVLFLLNEPTRQRIVTARLGPDLP